MPGLCRPTPFVGVQPSWANPWTVSRQSRRLWLSGLCRFLGANTTKHRFLRRSVWVRGAKSFGFSARPGRFWTQAVRGNCISAENRRAILSSTGNFSCLISIFRSGYFTHCGKSISISVNSQLVSNPCNDFPHLCTRVMSPLAWFWAFCSPRHLTSSASDALPTRRPSMAPQAPPVTTPSAPVITGSVVRDRQSPRGQCFMRR